MPPTRTVQGQVAWAGRTVEGQHANDGPEAQGPDTQPDANFAVEGQTRDNDVEGQDNDARPLAQTRPYPDFTAGAGTFAK